MNADHRWQGYDHAELYRQIHSGPGPDASTASVSRWVGVAEALIEIDADLRKAIADSGSGWEGAAGDQARGGLSPLGQWATDAEVAATAMRTSSEGQADNIGRARAEMPAPIAVTAEKPSAVMTGLTHLFGGQTDYEQQEAVANNAEQRAFEVMRNYEVATTDTMSSLGRFNRPPDVVLSTPPPVRGDGQSAEGPAGFGPSFARGAATGRSNRAASATPRSAAGVGSPAAPAGTRSDQTPPAPTTRRSHGAEYTVQAYAADYLVSTDDVYGDGIRVAPAVFGEDPS